MMNKIPVIIGVLLGLCAYLTICLIGNEIPEEAPNLLTPTLMKELL